MRARSERALELMMHFAERTGLSPVSPSRAARRYLWTDAFAVCNFLGLAHELRDERYEELALRLVSEVHRVLGRHRDGDRRTGWISGLSEEEGEAHPTRGGLRIGKPLPERGPDDPRNEQLEWERDGQYFHYLTKWMHALHQVTRATGQPRFAGWARELAHAAHRAFTHAPARGGPKRMYWKLSVDLSRPVVASMGQHDPLDGLVTYAELEATRDRDAAEGPSLRAALADFAAMVEPEALLTGDPLGLGGLLFDAYRVEQLGEKGAALEGLAQALLEAALVGVRYYAEQADLRLPADVRLAFRELGLSIGLAALEGADWGRASRGVREVAERLARYVPLRAEIEAFWLHPAHRQTESWLAHEDINEVMLATSLAPEGFLVIVPDGLAQQS